MTLWSRDQHEVTWQFEEFIFPQSQDLCSVTLAGCYLTRGGLARERLSCHQVLVAFAWNARSFKTAFPFSLLFFLLVTFSGRTDQYQICIRYVVCFQVMCFRQKQTVMVGLRGRMWSLALQPLKHDLIFPLAKCLWLPNFIRWWLTLIVSFTKETWSCKIK